MGARGYAHLYVSLDIQLYAHSFLLELASELGILGLGRFGVFAFVILKTARDGLRKHFGVTRANYLFTWGLMVFIFGLLNSMVGGDIPKDKILWFGSAFMWSAHMTEASQDEAVDLSTET